MASRVPEFYKLDSNDKWLEDCGAKGCTQKHNILKNHVMLLPGDQVVNWWDFLDILECYEKAAKCGVCTRCHWCKYYFRNLLAEVWGLTFNTWRTINGYFFTAVVFNPHDERYGCRPMTVRPRTRRAPSNLEKQMIKLKEERTLFRLKKKIGKRF